MNLYDSFTIGILGAVFANCLGMCTVFLIIFSDILIGDPSEPDGLIAELFPSLEPGSPFLDRAYVLAALLILILLPVSLSRNMASLGFLNAVGVGSVVAFALSTSIVAGTAVYQVNLAFNINDVSSGITLNTFTELH